MTKNIKSIFFVLTLVMLLVTVGVVCAADDANSTAATDNSVSDVAVSDTTSDTIAAEPATTSDDNKVDTKTIEKEEKNLKTTTKMVEVNNYNELTSAINSATSDSENDEYVINLNEGTYQITANANYNKGIYTPNITINANNQRLTSKTAARYVNYNNECNVTINDATITHKMRTYTNLELNNVTLTDYVTIYSSGVLTLRNSTINTLITNNGKLVLCDDVILGTNFGLSGSGTIETNNTNLIYPYVNTFSGNSTLNNITIDKTITNNGQMTLNNVTINNLITNNGQMTLNNVTIDNKIKNNDKLIISDDCIITENVKIKGYGEIITNLTLSDNIFNITKTVEVNNSEELNNYIENNGIIYFDGFYDYIINLNEGDYSLVNSFDNCLFESSTCNIIINGNNQTFNPLSFQNSCNNTINYVNMTTILTVGGEGNAANRYLTTLTLNQVTITSNILVYKNGMLILQNSTVLSNIDNRGTIIISDDTVFSSNVNLTNGNSTSSGTIITNNTNALYLMTDSFDGGCLKDITIDKDITIRGNFTLKNLTVDKTITNNGRLIISDDVIFTENSKIAGYGEIVTDNITKLLPYIETIHGNYTITDTTLNKTYNFMGNVTLDNCNITSTNNINYEILNINNSNIMVEDETTWITNNGLLIITNSNTSGNITNNRELYINNLPEDYTYDNTYHVITNATALLYFDTINGNTLNDKIQEGDTLDFQGTISGIPSLNSLVINKPVNIITSTNDGRIERFNSITYNNGASGSNITGLYTYNTQFYVRNANNIVFDNISNVVNSSAIGWGVGQTSIGHNSTNILVKNSYFYTKDNGGSSTFVFNWADNSTLVNSTIEADGNVGNLVYLTTYNVDIPSGTTANCNNQILNNTIRGPEKSAGICWAIVLSGANNTVDGNTIHYVGTGITGQWGSGITGQGIDDNATSLVNNSNHKIFNNKLYTGTGFTGITGCILVNNTFYNNSRFRIGNESLAINNTANNIEVMGINSIIRNNNIITNNTYTINGTGTNNTITDNYLKALDKYGDESVNLNKERNTIANNTPKTELIIDTTTFTAGQTTTIQAGIYFDGEIITDITKGKVTFKVKCDKQFSSPL